MSLLDSYPHGWGGLQGSLASALELRVAEAIGFVQSGQRQRWNQGSDAIGRLGEQTQGIQEVEFRGYISPGLPPQTNLQVGHGGFTAAHGSQIEWSQLVGILFCMPSTKLGKEEVLPHLDYFHHRSGSALTCFCPGYVRLKGEAAVIASQLTASIGESTWRFDAAEYNRLRSELEGNTTWRYSGESDLLVLQVHGDRGSIQLDFSTTILCNLEQMLKDGTISSFRAFFERLVQFAESRAVSPSAAWGLSDHLGVKLAGDLLVEAILGLLPDTAQTLYKKGKHFVVRDVSKAAWHI